MRNDYPAASRDACESLLLYLLEKRLGAKSGPRRLLPLPDLRRLLTGLPQGPLLEAAICSDGTVAFRVADQREPGRHRSERTTDEMSFWAIRWLCLPKAHLLFSRTDVSPDRKERHYLTFADHIGLTRIIADPKPGERVEVVNGDYLDMRRANLAKVPAMPGPDQNLPHKGRALAISTAVANFRETDTGHLPICSEGFEQLLREGFAFVDQLPLGKE